ncbi:hypothetical protein COCNU_04G008830 [Cocos nucifera]|uniref:DUF7036 domain-containing protein n=1 Tax=Cocos nucifera TaxID=13894 RepID=A0A8K0I6I2_COCNU|nr:hypothetical protein COCNU_04G008830 [Cocos nucifera]
MRPRCVVALVLGVAVLLSAVFWLPPFLRHSGDLRDRNRDPRFKGKSVGLEISLAVMVKLVDYITKKLLADIVASFRLQKPVALLSANISKLQYDIYEEIGVLNSLVVVSYLEPLAGSNWTTVVFAIWPYPKSSTMSSAEISILRESFMSLVTRQSTLHLTTSLFGNSSFFEVLKFPGGITIIPPQSAFLLQKVQPIVNFTLNVAIYEVQDRLSELKDQMKSGLLLNSYEVEGLDPGMVTLRKQKPKIRGILNTGIAEPISIGIVLTWYWYCEPRLESNNMRESCFKVMVAERRGKHCRQCSMVSLDLFPWPHNLYVKLTNSEGSTLFPPTTIETSIVFKVGNHQPLLPRLKQLAKTISNSSAGNLGLNHTVFGRVKQTSTTTTTTTTITTTTIIITTQTCIWLLLLLLITFTRLLLPLIADLDTQTGQRANLIIQCQLLYPWPLHSILLRLWPPHNILRYLTLYHSILLHLSLHHSILLVRMCMKIHQLQLQLRTCIQHHRCLLFILLMHDPQVFFSLTKRKENGTLL